MTSERKRDAARRQAAANFTTHGNSGHPLYDTWRKMIRRCATRPEYLEQGITVYEPWHEVSEFLAWADRYLGPRPPEHTLDRIDNDRGYEPGNLRWADAGTQARNRGHGSSGLPDCLCDFDCTLAPGLCPLTELPWEVAAGIAAAEMDRLRRLRLRGLPTLVEHLHTGTYEACMACVKQDPFWLDVLSDASSGRPNNAQEWCYVARGRPKAEWQPSLS